MRVTRCDPSVHVGSGKTDYIYSSTTSPTKKSLQSGPPPTTATGAVMWLP